VRLTTLPPSCSDCQPSGTFRACIWIALSLQSKNSYGCDDISMKILKISAPFISSPPNYIHNISISTEIFPSCLKYSLFKTGDKNNMVNYRPIWLLTSSSKVLEKVIYKRVLTRFNNHNILVTKHFGCRSRSSTEKASYNLICETLKDSNNRRIVGGIFLDLEETLIV